MDCQFVISASDIECTRDSGDDLQAYLDKIADIAVDDFLMQRYTAYIFWNDAVYSFRLFVFGGGTFVKGFDVAALLNWDLEQLENFVPFNNYPIMRQLPIDALPLSTAIETMMLKGRKRGYIFGTLLNCLQTSPMLERGFEVIEFCVPSTQQPHVFNFPKWWLSRADDNKILSTYDYPKEFNCDKDGINFVCTRFQLNKRLHEAFCEHLFDKIMDDPSYDPKSEFDDLSEMEKQNLQTFRLWFFNFSGLVEPDKDYYTRKIAENAQKLYKVIDRLDFKLVEDVKKSGKEIIKYRFFKLHRYISEIKSYRGVPTTTSYASSFNGGMRVLIFCYYVREMFNWVLKSSDDLFVEFFFAEFSKYFIEGGYLDDFQTYFGNGRDSRQPAENTPPVNNEVDSDRVPLCFTNRQLAFVMEETGFQELLKKGDYEEIKKTFYKMLHQTAILNFKQSVLSNGVENEIDVCYNPQYKEWHLSNCPWMRLNYGPDTCGCRFAMWNPRKYLYKNYGIGKLPETKWVDTSYISIVNEDSVQLHLPVQRKPVERDFRQK